MNILSFSESLAGISSPGTPAPPTPSAISFADALQAAQPGVQVEAPTAGCEIPQATDCVLETLRQQTTEAPPPPIFAARPGPPIASPAFEVVPQPVDRAIPAPAPEATAPQPLTAAVAGASDLAEPCNQEVEPNPVPLRPAHVPPPNVTHDRSRPMEESEPAPSQPEESEESEPQQLEQPIEPGPRGNRPRVGRNSGKAARAFKAAASAKASPEAMLPASAAASLTAAPKPELVVGEQPALPCEQLPPKHAPEAAGYAPETTVAVSPKEASPATPDQQIVKVVAQPQASQRVAPKGKRGAPAAEDFATVPQEGLPQAPVALLPVQAGPVAAPTEQPPDRAEQPPALSGDAALALTITAPPTQIAAGNQPEQAASERPQPATKRAADAPRLASAAVASEVARQLPIQGPYHAPAPPSQADPKANLAAEPGQAQTEPVNASAEQPTARWFGLAGLVGSEGATPEIQQASPLPTSFRDLVVREIPTQGQVQGQPPPPAQRPLLVELMQRIEAAETGQPLARAVKTVSEAPVKSGLEPLMALLSEKKGRSESDAELEPESENPEGIPSLAPAAAQAPSDAPKAEETAAPVKVLDQVEHAQHLARLQGKALIDKPRELEVHLHSHKLGEVAARVKVEADGQWSAHVQLRDAEVERSVRQELVQIQETRGLEGFTTSLSQDSRDQRSAFQGFAFDQQQSRTPFGLAPKKSVQPLTSADPSPIAKSSSVHGSPSGLNVRA